MATRRNFLASAGGAAAAALGGILPSPMAAAAPAVVSFSRIEDLRRYITTSRMAVKIQRRLRSPSSQRPLHPEERFRREARLAELNAQARAYGDMRTNRPDIVDSPQTLAHLARSHGMIDLPWHAPPTCG